MAKGRGGRGPTRMDKRREADAVEAREKDEKEKPDDEEVEEEVEADDGDDGDDDDDGAKKKKPKKKAAAKKPATAKKPAVKRVRVPKEVRQKAVWVVFDNASKRVGAFPFSQKADAEALLAAKIEEKKTTFYLNLVKEPIEA